MRIVFILLFVFLFSGCGQWIYTIHNQYPEDIIAGSVVLTPGQCVEFLDAPLIGDFPIQFRYKGRELFSKQSHPPAHYVISEKGEVVEKNTACPIEIVGKKPVKPVQTKNTTGGADQAQSKKNSPEEQAQKQKQQDYTEEDDPFFTGDLGI